MAVTEVITIRGKSVLSRKPFNRFKYSENSGIVIYPTNIPMMIFARIKRIINIIVKKFKINGIIKPNIIFLLGGVYIMLKALSIDLVNNTDDKEREMSPNTPKFTLCSKSSNFTFMKYFISSGSILLINSKKLSSIKGYPDRKVLMNIVERSSIGIKDSRK